MNGRLPGRATIWPLQFRSLSVAQQRIVLLLLGLVIFGAGLGLRDPWPADEPRFALVAKEMVETGNWLIPRRAGEIYADKPPLFFWLIASFYLITGSLRVAFLLPSLLGGLAVLLLSHDLARRLWSSGAAFVASLALLSSVQFVMQARSGQIDGLLVFWTTLGMYGICRHMLAGPAKTWWYIGFAAAGAGVITKGVGFLPLLLLIPSHFTPARRTWNWKMFVSGVLVMLAVILMWLVPMVTYVESSSDPELRAYDDNILLRQTAERYASPWHHFKWPGYFFVEVIPWAWLPLTLLLPWSIPALARRLRRRDPRVVVLLGWTFLVLLFFSLSSAKRGVYILPALPAFVLAHAGFLRALIRRVGVQRTARYASAVLGLACFTIAVALLIRPDLLRSAGMSYAAAWAIALALFLPAVAGTFATIAKSRSAVAGLGATLAILWVATGWGVLPEMNADRSATQFMRVVERRAGPRAEIGILGWKEQFALQASRPVETFGYGRSDISAEATEGARWLVRRRNRRLLLTGDHLSRCFNRASTTFIERRSREAWYLAAPAAVRRECLK